MGGHHAAVHQRFDDIAHALCHPVGQLCHRDHLGQLNVTHNLFAILRSAHGFLTRAFLLALHRREGFLTSTFATGQSLVQRQLARATTIVAALAATTVLLLAFRLLSAWRLLLGCARRSCTVFRCRLCSGSGGETCGFLFCFTLALFLFGLGLCAFFGFALFALFDLSLFATAHALFFTRLLFGLSRRGLIRFTRLGRLQRL